MLRPPPHNLEGTNAAALILTRKPQSKSIIWLKYKLFDNIFSPERQHRGIQNEFEGSNNVYKLFFQNDISVHYKESLATP